MVSDIMAASKNELKEEIAELREEVLEYVPGKASRCPERVAFPDNLYIGLFGRTGCGKTSLINSLKFAAHGRLRRAKWLQAATQEKAGGHTMFRRFADITEKIFVIDNRGLDDPKTEEAITELVAQLDGKRGYGSKVIWQGERDENDLDTSGLDLENLDKSGHPIGCAVFVFSARHDIDTNTTGLTEVIDFLHAHQGRYPVAVITHVDVAEKAHVQTLRSVLRVCGVSDIFEVANLTEEKAKLEEEYQLSLLNLIERCMTDGDETLIFKYYQKKEEERKKAIKAKREEKARKEEQEKRARELEERTREQERKALEEERTRLDMEFARKLQEQEYKFQMEQERNRAAALEREMEERERREQEREERYQKALREAEASKQQELRRIMEANRSKKDSECIIL